VLESVESSKPPAGYSLTLYTHTRRKKSTKKRELIPVAVRASDKIGREAFLIKKIRRYERISREAEKDRSWTAVVKAEDRVCDTRQQLDQYRAQQIVAQIPEDPAEHRTQLLVAAR
tara:strand:- start:11 stop:358 length:348 start_codon:yes stop_codon:yes gene_type:complete